MGLCIHSESERRALADAAPDGKTRDLAGRLLFGVLIGASLSVPLCLNASRTQTPQGGGLRFTEPSPLDFDDHDGYVSLFDGVSLRGWDGNPKFWRVENGAIVGESTPTNPSGNSYLVYRDLEARDFTLKFEIKIEGDGGSGVQYPEQDRFAVACEHSCERHRERRAGQPELDDDRAPSGLLAEPRLHGPVLFREYADANPGVARAGGRRLWRALEEAHGGDWGSRLAGFTRSSERLEPVPR